MFDKKYDINKITKITSQTIFEDVEKVKKFILNQIESNKINFKIPDDLSKKNNIHTLEIQEVINLLNET